MRDSDSDLILLFNPDKGSQQLFSKVQVNIARVSIDADARPETHFFPTSALCNFVGTKFFISFYSVENLRVISIKEKLIEYLLAILYCKTVGLLQCHIGKL